MIEGKTAADLIAGLEELVNIHGIRRVAEELVEICYAKDTELRKNDNWQDNPSATRWKKVGTRLGHAVHWLVKDGEWPS